MLDKMRIEEERRKNGSIMILQKEEKPLIYS